MAHHPTPRLRYRIPTYHPRDLYASALVRVLSEDDFVQSFGDYVTSRVSAGGAALDAALRLAHARREWGDGRELAAAAEAAAACPALVAAELADTAAEKALRGAAAVLERVVPAEKAAALAVQRRQEAAVHRARAEEIRSTAEYIKGAAVVEEYNAFLSRSGIRALQDELRRLQPPQPANTAAAGAAFEEEAAALVAQDPTLLPDDGAILLRNLTFPGVTLPAHCTSEFDLFAVRVSVADENVVEAVLGWYEFKSNAGDVLRALPKHHKAWRELSASSVPLVGVVRGSAKKYVFPSAAFAALDPQHPVTFVTLPTNAASLFFPASYLNPLFQHYLDWYHPDRPLSCLYSNLGDFLCSRPGDNPDEAREKLLSTVRTAREASKVGKIVVLEPV